MRKKRDHFAKGPDGGIREVRDEVRDEVREEEDVVRLGVDGSERVREVERLEVSRGRPGQRVSGEMVSRLGLLPELDEEMGEQEVQEVLDPEEIWDEGRKTLGKVPIGWVVVLVCFGLGVLFMALWRIRKGDEKLSLQTERVEARLEKEREEGEVAAQLTMRIKEVADLYLAARTVEEKLRHVRMPEKVRPLMEDYYRTHSLDQRLTEGFYFFEPIAVQRHPFLILKMQMRGGGDVVLVMEEGEDGDVRVDWESDVAYATMTLDEYVERKPLEATEFRVNVAYDSFYSFEFSDQDRYVSLFLSERDRPGFLFGYAERGSLVHEQLVEILGRDEEGKDLRKGERVVAPMLLRVRFLPDSRGLRSVLVEELVSPGWAVVTG
ncbi:MAG: hypothetical protein O3A87_11440, partial [Verrucomicrobia bacterium]|nr:hypothetical protein [Verrucomicrobiota bacterium]